MSASLTVIVPCYNPPEGWEKALSTRFEAFKNAMSGLSLELRFLVVDDGSARNTSAAHFERLRQFIPDVQVVAYSENRGKGYALRQGVAAATGDYFIVTDADFPYTPASMRRIADTLITAGGIAAGNRALAYYDQVPPFRRRLSQLLRWVLRTLLRLPVDDSQCGLKGFDEAGKSIFLKTRIERFLFDLEFLMLANGRIKVTAVPVELREGVVFSKIGFRILLTESVNFLRLVFRKG